MADVVRALLNAICQRLDDPDEAQSPDRIVENARKMGDFILSLIPKAENHIFMDGIIFNMSPRLQSNTPLLWLVADGCSNY